MSGSHPLSRPSLAPDTADTAVREDRQTAAVCLLARHGEASPAELFGLRTGDERRLGDATATATMDLYRRTGAPEVFESLVRLTTPMLQHRVRSRIRYLHSRLDPQEVLQDTFVNIYRYPDRFDGSRAGAFRAWASTIVDNTIRRHLRRAKSGPEIHLRPVEMLCKEPDVRSQEPCLHAIQQEACERALCALRVLLGCYLSAYHGLSERERFVLQMVEVKNMRYAELARILRIRPEALKMVVFRARRRIYDRISVMFARAAASVA